MDIIEKILKFICKVLGMTILAGIGFFALCGDLGEIVRKGICIILAIVALISFTDMVIKLLKAKKTPLLGDED